MKQVFNMGNFVNDASDNAKMFLNGNGKQLGSVLIAMIVVGLLLCLFGLKLVRIMAAVTGLLIGAVAGLAVCAVADLSGTAALVVVAVAAVVLAVLTCFLYRVGIFFWILCLSVGTAATLIDIQNMVQVLIAFAISVLLAVLAVRYIEPIVIIVTSLAGGAEAGMAAAELAGLTSNPWIGYGIGIALAVIGMIVQFMMQSRKVGKKEKIYSKKVKESVSMESEVEKARMILDDDDTEEESSETVEFLDDDIEIIGNLDDDLDTIEDFDDDLEIIEDFGDDEDH